MADENNITTLAKRLRPFIKMAAQEMVPVTPYDHGDLSGLASDDHLQYVHNTSARTITAVHTFSPATVTAPFIIGANGQGQTVIGLKADQLARSVTAGAGLTGGGDLTADRTINIGAGNGIQVGSDDVSIKLPTYSGLTADGTGLYIRDDIAGAGLTITNKVLAVGPGDGMSVGNDAVSLKTPGTLTYNSTNDAANNHTHAISNSSAPGAAASILSTDASGVLTLITLKTEVLQDRGITGSILINPAGDITLDPGGFDVLPYAGYEINLGALNKKYLTVHAAELWVETLVAQDTMATIGGRILVAPTTVLTRDLPAADTTIHVKHNQMVNGDRVYLEAGGQVEWIAITSGPTAESGGYYYSCTRNLDGSGANDWAAGDAVLNTGTTGDGYIDIYSIDSIRSGTQYGPTIVGNIRTGTVYSNLIEAWAVGNLNGLYGYGVDIYGAAFGKYVNNSSFLTIDPTEGIRMIFKNGLGANLTVAQWDINGSLTIGQVAASQDNIYIASGAISLRVNTTTYINLTTGGVITIGQVAASQDNIYMSAGALSIRNNMTERIGMTAAGILTIKDSGGAAVFTFDASAGAEFTKPLTLGSGGGIYQGTGTFATPTTGLKIYNSGGIGMLAGYNAGVVQWYGNTDGKLYAGAGYVWMDASGLTLKRSTLYYYGIRWTNSSGVVRGQVDTDDSGFYIDNRSNDGTRVVNLDMVNSSSGVRYISFQVGSGSYWQFDNEGTGSGGRGSVDFTWSDLAIDGGVNIGTEGGVCYDNDLVLAGGIMVGRTADPAAGNIEFTGNLSSYKNSTSYTGYIFVPLTTALSSTSWDGDAYATCTNTLIDLSAVFGAPAGIKAVLVSMSVKDGAANDTNDCFIGFCNTVGGTQYTAIRAPAEPAKYNSCNLIIPCNANGDIYYKIMAGSGVSFYVFIQIWGYWI